MIDREAHDRDHDGVCLCREVQVALQSGTGYRYPVQINCLSESKDLQLADPVIILVRFRGRERFGSIVVVGVDIRIDLVWSSLMKL